MNIKITEIKRSCSQKSLYFRIVLKKKVRYNCLYTVLYTSMNCKKRNIDKKKDIQN